MGVTCCGKTGEVRSGEEVGNMMVVGALGCQDPPIWELITVCRQVKRLGGERGKARSSLV